MHYVLARLGYAASLWVAVVAATFVLFHVVPTDPARAILGPNASEVQVEAVRRSLGLDRPLAEQFRGYIGQVAGLDFGRSYTDGRPVAGEVAEKLSVTAALACVVVFIVALYLAASISLYDNARSRRLFSFLEFVFVALPTLFVAVILALVTVCCFPFTRFTGSLATAGDWLYLAPPALVLALYPMGILGRIAREQMRNAAAAGYTRAARAMGLSDRTVVRKYVLRNSLVPLLAAFGNQVPLLLTSTFVVEIVFSVPGIGSLLLRSILARDLPMLEGIVIVTALFSIAVTMLLELAYPLADPRIRIEHAR